MVIQEWLAGRSGIFWNLSLVYALPCPRRTPVGATRRRPRQGGLGGDPVAVGSALLFVLAPVNLATLASAEVTSLLFRRWHPTSSPPFSQPNCVGGVTRSATGQNAQRPWASSRAAGVRAISPLSCALGPQPPAIAFRTMFGGGASCAPWPRSPSCSRSVSFCAEIAARSLGSAPRSPHPVSPPTHHRPIIGGRHPRCPAVNGGAAGSCGLGDHHPGWRRWWRRRRLSRCAAVRYPRRRGRL